MATQGPSSTSIPDPSSKAITEDDDQFIDGSKKPKQKALKKTIDDGARRGSKKMRWVVDASRINEKSNGRDENKLATEARKTRQPSLQKMSEGEHWETKSWTKYNRGNLREDRQGSGKESPK